MEKKEVLHTIFPFLSWWPEVNRKTLKADLLAGFTGAVVVIPQGVAFALIAGLPPVYGLYTAMITPIVAALFGSSRHLVSGPATAISIVVFAAISQYAEPGSQHYIRLVLTLTFLAGVFQLALGLAQMGTLVNFVSHVVVIGFTAGAAILIAGSQLKQVFAINVPVGVDFFEGLQILFRNMNQANWYALAVALVTLFTAILIKQINSKIPFLFLAMVAGSLTGWILGGESNGIQLVGKLEGYFPPLSSPDFSFKTMRTIAPNAFAIALLGLIEAVAIARAIGMKSQQQIDGNQEFIGQGLSNIAGSFFSSYAGSGSFTRSGINYEAGARTPLSSVFGAVLLMLLMFFIAPLTAHLPIAAMGGIILLVAFNLIDFHHIKTVIKTSKSQTVVLAITFFSTLFLDLEFAIYLGVLFSLFFYLRQSSKPKVAVLAPDPDDDRRRFLNLERKPLTECPQLKILRVDGGMYFGAVFNIAGEIRSLTEAEGIKHVLIVANGISVVDVAGAEWLVQESYRLKMKGGGLYISGMTMDAQDSLIRGGYKDKIGKENFFATKAQAIAVIFNRLDRSICERCTARIFRECKTLPPPIEESD